MKYFITFLYIDYWQYLFFYIISQGDYILFSNLTKELCQKLVKVLLGCNRGKIVK